jgi:hypothetical protein
LPRDCLQAKLSTMQAVAKSVLAGTFGGVFLPLCVLLPTFMFNFADPSVSNPWSKAPLLLYPLGLSFVFVCLGMIVIGVPATAILKRVGREGPGYYGVIGAVAGGLIALGVFGGAGIFAFCGMLSGAMTGYGWGSRRLTANSKQVS